MPSGRRVFEAFIRIGSPPGLVVSDGGGVGESGGDMGDVNGVSISTFAAGGIGGERAEQTKGSVLIEGGGIACWLWGGI